MSGLMDLCACICAQIQRQLDSVNSILQTVNGHEVITSSGSAADFGLPAPQRPDSFGSAALLPMILLVLFVMMLMSIRRQTSSGVTNHKPPSFGPNGSSSSGSPPPPAPEVD